MASIWWELPFERAVFSYGLNQTSHQLSTIIAHCLSYLIDLSLDPDMKTPIETRLEKHYHYIRCGF